MFTPLSYIFTPLSALNLNLLNAIGRSDLFLKIDLLKIPLIFITMAITFPISLKAVAIGKTITAFIYFYMNAFMIGRLYGFDAFKQLICCWKGIVASLLMSFFVILITSFITNSLIQLIIGIITGIVSYTFILFILKEEEFTRIINKLKKKAN